MFYYYNDTGVVKMISQEEIETDLNVIELPEEDLTGKLAQIVEGELVLEDNPALVSEAKKEALESLKTEYLAKAEAGAMTLEDMNDFVKAFL